MSSIDAVDAVIVSVTDYYGPRSEVRFVAGPFPAEAAEAEMDKLPEDQREPDYDPAVSLHVLGDGQCSPTRVVLADVLCKIDGDDWSPLWEDVLTCDEAAGIDHLASDPTAHIDAATTILADRGIYVVAPEEETVKYFVNPRA